LEGRGRAEGLREERTGLVCCAQGGAIAGSWRRKKSKGGTREVGEECPHFIGGFKKFAKKRSWYRWGGQTFLGRLRGEKSGGGEK